MGSPHGSGKLLGTEFLRLEFSLTSPREVHRFFGDLPSFLTASGAGQQQSAPPLQKQVHRGRGRAGTGRGGGYTGTK